MKLLAIDAGNTRVKWGWFDGERWASQSWVASSNADALGGVISSLPEPEAIVVSNVAGAAVREAIVTALAGFGTEPRWIRSEAEQCGVRSSYADATQLGCDRWAALVGAWRLFRGPCVVVNAGTTLTVDALSGEGVFLGGFIVPGIDLMRAVLARSTAQLGLDEGRFTYFPSSTADAITSGAVNALAGSVERMLGFMEGTGQVEPLTVLSGGASPILARHLNARIEVVDNLVLEGLLTIAMDDT